MLKRLRNWLKHETWEPYYDYCDVFDGFSLDELVVSGKECSEDCENHPGSKVMLGSRGTIWYP